MEEMVVNHDGSHVMEDSHGESYGHDSSHGHYGAQFHGRLEDCQTGGGEARGGGGESQARGGGGGESQARGAGGGESQARGGGGESQARGGGGEESQARGAGGEESQARGGDESQDRVGGGDESQAQRPSSSLGQAPSIEDFDILKPISRGAYGKVFLCHRKDRPERKLAVKVMKKAVMVQKNMTDQVIAERNAAALAKSPFCVTLLYCLQTTNNVFLVMEYMIGGDLKSLLAMYGFFPEHQAVFYLAECVLALQYLHNRGIVHRDIKPDNMLLSASGHLKLTDFGLSTTGLRDRDPQVADLVGRTPWHAARSHLVRTPGQILSLTSHLSFSSMQSGPESPGGSFTTSSSPPPPLHPATPLLPSSSPRSPLPLLPRTTPCSAPEPGQRAGQGPRRILRKNSFTEALALLPSKALRAPASSPRRPGRPSSPREADSSYRLQELPNSSMEQVADRNRTMEFEEDKENQGEELPAFPDTFTAPLLLHPPTSPRHLPPTTPPHPSTPPHHDEDSRGSLSSSPKPPSSLLPHPSVEDSFLHKCSAISPVQEHSAPPHPSYLPSSPHRLPSSPHHLTSTSLPSSSPSPPHLSSPLSLAAANMRALREPERLRFESFEGSLSPEDTEEESVEEREEAGETMEEVEEGPSTPHSSIAGFKVPTPLPTRKRKASSSCTGLTEDLTDLMVVKRPRTVEEVEEEVEEGGTSSTKSASSSSSEEEQREGYGCSTPVQPSSLAPLSAVPRHMKGFKAVKFVSPAGVTPVHHAPTLAKLPLSLAALDAGERALTPPLPTSPPPSSIPATPFRTPKSVGRRGRGYSEGGSSSYRLLGTPDYLAPELLLRAGHSSKVDWWALGVCLYEFLVGVPPFSAATPEEVFHNILEGELEWPEGEEALSAPAVAAVLALLETSPASRADGAAVRGMALTRGVDWPNQLEAEAPFVPRPDDATDTTYFQARNSMQGLTVSEVDM